MLEKHLVNRIACFFLCVFLATHNFVFFEIYDRNTSGAYPLIFISLLMVYFYESSFNQQTRRTKTTYLLHKIPSLLHLEMNRLRACACTHTHTHLLKTAVYNFRFFITIYNSDVINYIF